MENPREVNEKPRSNAAGYSKDKSVNTPYL